MDQGTKKTGRFSAVFAALFLGGCALFGGDDPLICPETGLVHGADEIPLLSAADGKLLGAGWIRNYGGGCRADGKGGAHLELTLDFAARKSKTDEKTPEISLPYFIAVLAPDETILQRQSFTVTVPLDAEGHGRAVEEHDIYVPGGDGKNAAAHKVVAGFVLTPEQATFNRKENHVP